MPQPKYRKPIPIRPPIYHDREKHRAMLAPFAHKIKTKCDEEYLVAQIIANMHIVARWFPALMPNLYLESGLHSGLMMTMSAPSQRVVPDMSFPGDIDILAIPYDEGDLILSDTLAVEVKILRGEKNRPGKSPSKFGCSQASSLLKHGFPHVAVGHIIVTDDPLDNSGKTMLVGSIGKNEVITSLTTASIDMFEHDLARRDFGKLAKRCGKHIGCFAMNYDGVRTFEPKGHSCERNPEYKVELFEQIYEYYRTHSYFFFEAPRYSNSEIKSWEKRIEENPETQTPWNVYRKLLKGKRILELSTLAIEVDGQKRIGHLCRTESHDFILCG